MYAYKVLIVDDDEQAGRSTEIALELFVPKENMLRVRSLGEAKHALQDRSFDLAILDIAMTGGSGFELAQYIQSAYPDLPYIFATGYTQYALDGYKFQPLDFLVKPFTTAALGAALERLEAKQGSTRTAPARIGVPFNGGFHVLDVDKILYVEKSGRNVIVHSAGGEDITIQKYAMERMEEMLDGYGFLRVHKSFLVSVKSIESVSASPLGTSYEMHLSGVREAVPVSRGKYAGIREVLERRGIRFLN